MSCPSEHLSEWLDGRAPELADHVASCPACGAEAKRLGGIRDLLRAVEEDPALAPDPVALARRVRERSSGPPRWLLALAIGLGVVMLSLPFLARPRAKATPTPVAPRTETALLKVELDAPDAALFDKIQSHFRACPGTVDAERTPASLELRCVAPPSAAWTEFKAATGRFLSGLSISNGRWEWSLR